MTRNSQRNSQKTGRGQGRPFKPGVSGNPNGRPRLPAQIVELRALAREHTPEALNAIVTVMGDMKAPASARVAAASELLDRGWGRPTAALEHSGPDGGPLPIALTPMDWGALIRKVTGQEPTVPEAGGGCE
jgi:hypothetical protein